jgi:hypothetical protein
MARPPAQSASRPAPDRAQQVSSCVPTEWSMATVCRLPLVEELRGVEARPAGDRRSRHRLPCRYCRAKAQKVAACSSPTNHLPEARCRRPTRSSTRTCSWRRIPEQGARRVGVMFYVLLGVAESRAAGAASPRRAGPAATC